jgi:DNA polymerase III delta prime subunit
MVSSPPFLTKYQPTRLVNFEMEQANKALLKTLLELDRISLLFTGNVGCGKTTLIKIMLREYYKNHPNVSIDASNRDILYITNLKEQGISYFRGEFKMFCQTFPEIPGKQKIVVIDDIDGVNFHCQQLLRTCIDKYPKIHFIAGCTNINNVIDALQSRFTIVWVPLLNHASMMRIATKITKAENIQIDLKSKKAIVSNCKSQLKKLITYLEKIKLMDMPIDSNNINMVFMTTINTNFNLFLKQNNIHSSINILYELYDSGYSIIDIFDKFLGFIKELEDMSDDKKYEIITLIGKYMARVHTVHDDPIELALFTNQIHLLKNLQ